MSKRYKKQAGDAKVGTQVWVPGTVVAKNPTVVVVAFDGMVNPTFVDGSTIGFKPDSEVEFDDEVAHAVETVEAALLRGGFVPHFDDALRVLLAAAKEAGEP